MIFSVLLLRGTITSALWPHAPQTKASLLIGHHLLEGKIVNLPKPLAVVHRSNTRSPTKADQSGGGETAPDNNMEWSVEAIIKRKILFAKRPMPVVNVGIAK